jgi:hypothetical protein
MTASRYLAGGMVLAFGLVGCSRALPPVPEASLGKLAASQAGDGDLSTPTESIDLAALLKLPRPELAQRCDDLEKTIRRQDQYRVEGKLPFTLLPDVRLPLVVPVFREAVYSRDRGLSLPPYLRVDAHDSAIAFHLARYGDLEAAAQLLEPGDDDAARLMRQSAPEKAYPVEWTRLVALLLHTHQMSLATDNKEGAKSLMSLHKQLRSVLDDKAKQGPLGAALLGRGLGTLKLAAAAWKASNRDDLDAQIKSFLASTNDVPAYDVAAPRQMDDLAQVFGAKPGSMALIASAPGRVADLLSLNLPTDESDTCVAFGDSANKATEILFTYRPTLFDFHNPEQFAQPLEELLTGRKDNLPSGAPRRVWDLSRGKLDVTLTPVHPTLGAVVRIQLGGTSRAPELTRDFGPVHLDRTFEMSRRLAGSSKRGNSQTLTGAAMAALPNPLKSRPLRDVVIEREPKHDLVSRVAFNYADNKDAAPAAGNIARSLFTNLGRPNIVFGEAGSSIDFAWNDAQTRYSLQFPYTRDKAIALEARDVSGSNLDNRATVAARKDANDRLERVQAQKPFAVIPRQVETMKLGMSRAEFKRSLPRSAQLVEREIPGGQMAAFIGQAQQPNEAVVREWFGRFENDKLVDLRIRYVGAFGKKLDAYKKKLGTPEPINGPAGLWADLPKRGNSVSYTWQDDVTLLTCRQESYGLEIELRDCPAEHPEGAPLPALSYLGRGPGDITLGMSKDALIKAGGQPSEANAFTVKTGAKDSFDAIVAWVDDGKVSRIVARHKAAAALKGESQASKVLLQQWAGDSRNFGWPNRQDSVGQNLQSLASRDDQTRFRIFWQEEAHGLSVYSEWKEVK